MRLEPFRIVTRDVRRRATDIRLRQACTLVGSERFGSILRAISQPSDGVDVHPSFALKHAQQNCARCVGTHDIGARCAPSQRVVNQPRDCGAVAGAGKAVREAPRL